MGLRSVVIAAISISSVCAWVFPFHEVVSDGDFVSYGKFAVYAKGDVPGRLDPAISLKAQITSAFNVTIVLAVAASKDVQSLLDFLHTQSYQDIEVCCWALPCQNFTLPDTLVHRFAVSQATLSNATTVTWEKTINHTDLYDVFVAVCGVETPTHTTVEGEIAVLNPFGYMPAETYPFLQFYWIASCAYLLLLLVWLIMLCCYWESAITLQKWYIPAVLLVCLLEDAVSYISWQYLNSSGAANRMLLLSILVLNSVRNTLARILLLVVSMGYGITIAQLSKQRWITALGVVFFVSNLAYVIAAQIAHLRPIQIQYLLLATFPVSLVNTAFYMWTFTSLTTTIQKLKTERQEFKLRIFKKLCALFVVAISLSLLWFAVECYYRFAHTREEYWQILWRFDAAWHIIFYVMLLGVIWLWRPTSKSKDLAFTLELPDLPDLSKSDLPKSHEVELKKYDIGYEGEST